MRKPLPSIFTGAARLAVCLPSFRTGGAERVAVNLIDGLHARGLEVDAVAAQAVGPLSGEIPAGVPIVDLGAPRVARAVWPLARYLLEQRPAGLIVHVHHLNAAVVAARTVARVPCPLVLVEHNTLGEKIRCGQLRPGLKSLLRWAYRRHETRLVAVSEGVAASLAEELSLPRRGIEVIANPVVDARFDLRAAQTVDHPWLRDGGQPVIVAAGRLVKQKDFALLLAAFARLRTRRGARLMILGDGPCREELERQRRSLACGDDIDLVGWVDNPLPYLRAARVTALSSRYEGLPTVLIESLACGTPCVATDCPSGPREILENGRHGVLCGVGDAWGMADALDTALDRVWDREALVARGRRYGVSAAVDRYLELLAPPRAKAA